MKKLLIVLGLLSLCAVVVAAGASIRVTWIGNERLIDSILYPDGSTIVVTEGTTFYQFTFVDSSGDTSGRETSMIPCPDGIDRMLVRAVGRYVTLTVEGKCGVNLIGYELPERAIGLDGRYQNTVFLPLSSSD